MRKESKMASSINTGNPKWIVVLHAVYAIAVFVVGACLLALGIMGTMPILASYFMRAFLIVVGVVFLAGGYSLWMVRPQR